MALLLRLFMFPFRAHDVLISADVTNSSLIERAVVNQVDFCRGCAGTFTFTRSERN